MGQSSGKSVAVVGSGLGGLAAACTLAARGHDVTIIEKNPWLGGKAAVLEADGHRFDMGPTILTIPSVLRRIFGEAGLALEERMDLVRLDPQWRCFFEDGGVLDLAQDTEAMSSNLDAFSPGSSQGYRNFLALSKRLDAISQRFFFWKPIGNVFDMFEWKNILNPAMLLDVIAMRPASTVAGTVRKHVPDHRVAQMLDHFNQYVGSSPYASPAVLCGIAHMQTGEGVWYPMGGTGAVPKALARLASELGVKVMTGVEVTAINQHPTGAVSGVTLSTGESLPFDVVVSNSDSVRTHRELLKPGKASRKFENRRSYEPACSGVVLYLGLDKRYEHIAHHDFVFSRDAEEEFDAIYHKGEPAPDPTCYLCAPAITEPGVAPPGGESLYVLVHTPYLRPHHDWKQMFPKYREVILSQLERTAGMKDIRGRIRMERALTPQDIHDRYRVLNGAIYGLASHGRLNGAFKPSNRSPDVPGLYLCGGAAHPGPGMPMVLMSGWIAGDTVDSDLRGSKPRVAAPATA
ncbi:MAG: phytoene desaturase family protein [Planctomycetota bacterium]